MFSVLMIGAVTAPILENWRSEPRDGFPLSYYPMFSYERGLTESLTYLVGIDAEGRPRNLHYRYVARGGMNQTRRQINRLVGEGRAASLCSTAARNLAAYETGWQLGIVGVEIRRGTYDLKRYFTTTDRAPLTEELIHSCAVERART